MCGFNKTRYVKSLVYTNFPNTLSEVVNNIRAAFAKIDADMPVTVDQNFRFRLFQCIDQSRGPPSRYHFQMHQWRHFLDFSNQPRISRNYIFSVICNIWAPTKKILILPLVFQYWRVPLRNYWTRSLTLYRWFPQTIVRWHKTSDHLLSEVNSKSP